MQRSKSTSIPIQYQSLLYGKNFSCLNIALLPIFFGERTEEGKKHKPTPRAKKGEKEYASPKGDVRRRSAFCDEGTRRKKRGSPNLPEIRRPEPRVYEGLFLRRFPTPEGFPPKRARPGTASELRGKKETGVGRLK